MHSRVQVPQRSCSSSWSRVVRFFGDDRFVGDFEGFSVMGIFKLQTPTTGQNDKGATVAHSVPCASPHRSSSSGGSCVSDVERVSFPGR